MDPLTQGVFGAIAAQIPADKSQLGKASLVGALSGMAADLDILIRSANDSLLALEFHRHFTHSLLFIPIGGALCATFFYLCFAKRWQLGFKPFWLWCTLGYATHGLLDGCTSYGTRLLWPLTDERFAWDLVSVIDPIFSAILLFLILAAIFRRNHRYSIAAVAWIGFYLGLAAIQHGRALDWGYQLAESRGHKIDRLHAKPSFGNIEVWKIIYESDGRFYISAYRPGIIESKSWAGESVAKLDVARDFPWLNLESQQALDIERFREFSSGFVALDPNNSSKIGDIRYSQLPHQIQPLWAIELNPQANNNEHARYVTQRGGNRETFEQLLAMILE